MNKDTSKKVVLSQEQSYKKDRIEELRQKLVDTSARTNLISFKHNERNHSHIRIIDEIPDQLYEKINSSSKGMSFISLPEDEDYPKDEKTPEFEDAYKYIKMEDEKFRLEFKKLADDNISIDSPKYINLDRELKDSVRKFLDLPVLANRYTMTKNEYATHKGFNPNYELPKPHPGDNSKAHTDDDIQTLLFENELKRKLEILNRKAKVFEQEYGINVLFISFGFLSWAESEHSEKIYDSPLLLLEVEMIKERRGKKIVYKIKSVGEDIKINLALKHRLNRDFGIVLPDFNEGDTLEKYLKSLDKLTKDKTGWKVNRYVTTGLFNFSKISLWNDLNADNWSALLNHPILSKLLYGSNKDNSDIDSNHVYDIDSEEIQSKLNGTYLDADSSQYSAVVDALSGKDLVIQGPPGTGKSQTISNIIASLLEQQKRVLFVAEKQVALEVVENRLKQIGLGKFVLPMHGKNTKRKTVVDSLGERLNISQQKNHDHDKILHRLNQQKSELIEYKNLMNQSFGESELTIHDIHWKHTKLKDELKSKEGFNKLETLRINDCSKISKSVYLSRKQLVEQYKDYYLAASLHAETKEDSNAWDFVVSHELTVPELSEVKSITSEISKKFIDTCKKLSSNKSLLRLSPHQLNNTRKIFEETSQNISSIFYPLIKHLYNKEDKSKIQKLIVDLEELIRIKSMIYSTLLDGPTISDDFALLIKTNEQLKENLIFSKLPEELLKNKINTINQVIDDYKLLNDQLSDCKEKNKFLEDLSKLDTKNPNVLITLLNIIDVAKDYEDEVLLNRSEAIFDQQNWKELRQAHKICEKLKNVRADLEKTCDLNIHQDIELLKNQLPKYLSANIFNKVFKNTKIDSALKIIINKKPKFPKYHNREDRINIIQKYIEYKEGEASIISNDSLKQILVNNFNGIDTDFDLLEKIINLKVDIDNRISILNSKSKEAYDFFLNAKFSDYKSILSIINDKPFSDLYISINSQFVKQPFLEFDSTSKFQKSLKETINNLLELSKELNNHNFNDHLDFYDLNSCLELFIDLDQKSNNVDEIISHLNIDDDYQQNILFSLKEIDNSIEFSKRILNEDLPDDFKKVLHDIDFKNDLESYSDILSEVEILYSEKFSNEIKRFESLTEPDIQSFFNLDLLVDDILPQETNDLFDVPIGDLNETFREATNHEDDLINIYNLNNINHQLDLVDLGQFSIYCGVYYPKEIDCIVQKYEYLYFKSLIHEAYKAFPMLNQFNGIKLGSLRSEFKKLDTQLMEAKCVYLNNILSVDHIPMGVGKGKKKDYTDGSLIKHEVGKKKMHIATRLLMERAGKAITVMKPCMMMSPYSVAQLLPQRTSLFDAVIIDEASQMKPEDAIGATLRGDQLIVVGDPKQLPPTSFFQIMDKYDDEFENEDRVVSESILDLALAQFQNRRDLLWHYRSRHESLINFSNTKFYNNDLIIFPSPTGESTRYGVQMHFVENGLFKRGAGINENEAEVVVNKAIELMIAHPDKSIGIATLNKKQQERIEDKIQLLKATNEKVRKYIDSYDNTINELFIKNLETVQGDERDIIIISTVYGPDDEAQTNQGKRIVHNRFGPINNVGGERRLNVLVTRAKESIHLVTSLRSSDITSNQFGAVILKSFIDYAETGKIEASYTVTGKEPDSDFEVFVAKTLKDRGYEIEPQLGVAGYFIDIAVKNPHNDGYLCAIECDGASYHSGKSARDRDRLRQDVLEKLGWNFYRIWSTDWFTDTAHQKIKLISHLTTLSLNEIKN